MHANGKDYTRQILLVKKLNIQLPNGLKGEASKGGRVGAFGIRINEPAIIHLCYFIPIIWQKLWCDKNWILQCLS